VGPRYREWLDQIRAGLTLLIVTISAPQRLNMLNVGCLCN
jgi:hypothetical protein